MPIASAQHTVLSSSAQLACESMGSGPQLEAQFWLDGPESEAGRVGAEERALLLQMNGIALVAEGIGEEIEPDSAAERLGELRMPVLMILGGRDLTQVTERGKRIVEEAGDGRLTMFEGAAHLPQMEEPQAFAEVLRRFLRELPSCS